MTEVAALNLFSQELEGTKISCCRRSCHQPLPPPPALLPPTPPFNHQGGKTFLFSHGRIMFHHLIFSFCFSSLIESFSTLFFNVFQVSAIFSVCPHGHG
jgi:hypothetical protein